MRHRLTSFEAKPVLQHLSTSLYTWLLPPGGRLLLLVYRCYALLHIAVVLGVMLQNRKLTFLLHFFTNW